MSKVFQRLFRSVAGDASNQVQRVASDERLYVIGDVHGRADLLVAMLDKLTKDAQFFEDDRLVRFVFLGDYIDRGDQSAQVLDILCRVKDASGHSFDFLMGNHEAAMLTFLNDPRAGVDWIGWGGRQTLFSYGVSAISRDPDQAELIAACDELQDKCEPHLAFLRSLKRYAISGDVVCAHACLDPALTLEEQPDASLFWGQIPSGLGSGLPGRRLVHGHFDASEPVVLPDRICVDTGAYYSGRLTAVRLDDSEAVIQVDLRDLG